MNRSGILKVLIAEDDMVAQHVYQKSLPPDGFSVIFASDGEEALRQYHQWAPDLMVLDIMMPGMTGYNVLKQVRGWEKENGRRTAVIMATGLSDKSDILDCAKIGIQGYIIKPIRHDEIASRLAAYYQAFAAEHKHA